MLEKVSKIISAFTDERGEIKNILEKHVKKEEEEYAKIKQERDVFYVLIQKKL